VRRLSLPEERDDAGLVPKQTGVEVGLEMPVTELRARLPSGCPARRTGQGKLVLEIYEKTTEPNPGGRSSSWTTQRVSPWLVTIAVPRDVERFEPVCGRELGNAFSELTDPEEQRRNFAAQASPGGGRRRAMPVDATIYEPRVRLPPPGPRDRRDRLVMLLSGAEPSGT